MIKNNKGLTAFDILDHEIDKEKKRQKSMISQGSSVEYQGQKISKIEKVDLVYNERRTQLKEALMRN